MSEAVRQDEVSERGRALWRRLAGADGVGRDIQKALPDLTHEDVNLLAAELRTLAREVGSEASRRDEQARAAGVARHSGSEQ